MLIDRDLKNSMDTAFDEGKIEGEQLGIEKTAKAMKGKGMDYSVIAEVTEIEKL